MFNTNTTACCFQATPGRRTGQEHPSEASETAQYGFGPAAVGTDHMAADSRRTPHSASTGEVRTGVNPGSPGKDHAICAFLGAMAPQDGNHPLPSITSGHEGGQARAEGRKRRGALPPLLALRAALQFGPGREPYTAEPTQPKPKPQHAAFLLEKRDLVS